MADVAFTSTSIRAGAGAIIEDGVAGESIVAGDVVFKNASNLFMIADCTDTDLDEVDGFALNSAAINQHIRVQKGGKLTCDNIVAETVYVLSAAGAICPVADLATADRVIKVGTADSTTVLNIEIVDSGVILDIA